MTQAVPDIFIFLCKNCIPSGRALPVQWTENGMHVRIKEIPCSGKIDAQYILHALEGGVEGICIVTCAEGKCTLSQGNYRAKVRVQTVQRLLEEIGADPNRAQLILCSENETPEHLKEMIDATVHQFTSPAVVGQK